MFQWTDLLLGARAVLLVEGSEGSAATVESGSAAVARASPAPKGLPEEGAVPEEWGKMELKPELISEQCVSSGDTTEITGVTAQRGCFQKNPQVFWADSFISSLPCMNPQQNVISCFYNETTNKVLVSDNPIYSECVCFYLQEITWIRSGRFESRASKSRSS